MTIIFNSNTMKTSEIFFRKFDQNFMTPHVVKHIDTQKYYIEISSGSGMTGDTIYGLTVYDRKTEKLNEEHSGLCHSKEEAFQKVNEISKIKSLKTKSK